MGKEGKEIAGVKFYSLGDTQFGGIVYRIPNEEEKQLLDIAINTKIERPFASLYDIQNSHNPSTRYKEVVKFLEDVSDPRFLWGRSRTAKLHKTYVTDLEERIFSNGKVYTIKVYANADTNKDPHKRRKEASRLLEKVEITDIRHLPLTMSGLIRTHALTELKGIKDAHLAVPKRIKPRRR